MKHLLTSLLLLAAFTTALFADSPEAIRRDYQKQAAAALTKLNSTLEQATTALIAKLISSGDTAGAEQLTAQLKSKLAGEPVPTPQASATLLFAQYDQARTKALEPAHKAAVARIDAMLAGKEGKNLDVVTTLGKVRAEIGAGQAPAAVPTAAPSMPEQWTYHATEKPDGSVGPKHGDLHFHPDGTVSIHDFANPKIPATGTWKANAKGDKITLAVPGFGDWKMAIKGTTGTLDRPEEASPDKVWGMRYLRARTPAAPPATGTAAAAAAPAAASAAPFPMRWSYHLKPDRLANNGFIDMKPDGTLVMGNVNDSTPGKWSATSKANVLDLVFETDKGTEKCQMKIDGNEAELYRPIGTRYLKAR